MLGIYMHNIVIIDVVFLFMYVYLTWVLVLIQRLSKSS